MNQSNIVILGGGMVAGYAAKQLVELGLPKGELAILSADNSVPYERPPLSKGFLAGKDTEDAIRINPEDFYKEHGIGLRLQCEVATVHIERKRLILKNSDEFGFQKLIVATGARPRTLNIPGSRLRKSVLPANHERLQRHPECGRKGKARQRSRKVNSRAFDISTTGHATRSPILWHLATEALISGLRPSSRGSLPRSSKL